MRSAVFLLLLGCGALRPLPVLPAPALFDITKEFIATVNAQYGSPLLVLGTGGVAVEVRDTAPPNIAKNPAWCGFYDGWRNIGVNPMCEGLWQSIVAHEIGHALGLIHSSNKESVMYPRARVQPVEALADSVLYELSIQMPGAATLCGVADEEVLQ